MKELTLVDSADQQFSTILNNRRVSFRFRYNPTSDRWSFDLSIDDLPVLMGKRVVLGVNLLATTDFGIGQLFAVPVTSGAVPNRDSLPARLVRLYWVADEELEAAKAS